MRQRDGIIAQVTLLVAVAALHNPPQTHCTTLHATHTHALHSTPHYQPSTHQMERNRDRDAEPASDRAPVQITDADDLAFTADLTSQVRSWLELGAAGPEELALPAVNGYRRLLTYQTLRGEAFAGEGRHQGFVVRKVSSPGCSVGWWLASVAGVWQLLYPPACCLPPTATNRTPTATPTTRHQVEQRGNPYLVLIRAQTPEAAAALERQQFEEQVAAARDAAGFSAVFELMRKSGKPAGACSCCQLFGSGWLGLVGVLQFSLLPHLFSHHPEVPCPSHIPLWSTRSRPQPVVRPRLFAAQLCQRVDAGHLARVPPAGADVAARSVLMGLVWCVSVLQTLFDSLPFALWPAAPPVQPNSTLPNPNHTPTKPQPTPQRRHLRHQVHLPPAQRGLRPRHVPVGRVHGPGGGGEVPGGGGAAAARGGRRRGRGASGGEACGGL